MTFRGTESPMDFEWQGYGPVDVNSPFHKHVLASQNKKRNFNQFESPIKSPAPALREPNNKPFFFSDTPLSTQQPSPFRNPSFTTPRKPFDIDFSSGPENSSPADQADNEDTPDAKSSAIEFKSGGGDNKPSNKRNSLFGFYGRFAPSPGRGEIRKPHSDAIAKRIHKRRRKAQNFEKQLVLGRRSSEDTSDEELEPNNTIINQKQRKVHEVGWMTGLFTFIHTYPDAPSIIAKYLQVFFNAVILGGCLFMFYSFYATIQADVDRASQEAMEYVLADMAKCTKDFVENKCAADMRLPALEEKCNEWALCMARDANAVKRAKLSAHTFAEIFNSFVEPISLKTMIFTTTLVIVGLLINNATFTLYRRQQEHHTDNPAYRHPSGHYINHHPTQPAITHMGQFPTVPGTPYSQQQHSSFQPHLGNTPWNYTGGNNNNDYANQQQQRLEYSRSPSKEYRNRSRSPEKKVIS